MSYQDLESPHDECAKYMREKLDQLATVVAARYAGAVEGAKAWGRANKPELMDRCDDAAEERLGELMENGLVGEFRAACVDFFRAYLELYKAHADFLGLSEAA